MVKTVNIHIHSGNDAKELEKTSDLAPSIGMQDGSAMEEHSDSPHDEQAELRLQSMIDHTPDSPKGHKTLQGSAKELMLSKMASMKKKGLK